MSAIIKSYDVQADFGATGLNSADDWYSIQSAIFAAASNTALDGYNTSCVVSIPPGNYKISKPLWIPKGGMVVKGAGSGVTKLLPTHAAGPTILEAPSTLQFPTAAALATGGSSVCLQLGGTSGANALSYLNLNDDPGIKLSGLTQFNIEFYINLTSATESGSLLTSLGTRDPGVASTTSFVIDTSSPSGAGHFIDFKLNLGGTLRTITSASRVPLNTPTFVEGSYDGSNMRLFINGIQVASGAFSGTVTRGDYEIFTLGATTGTWPDGAIVGFSALGAIDSIRISNIGRRTTSSSYTPPTAKLGWDANTLCLLNFEEQLGIMTKGRNKGNGFSWFPFRQLPWAPGALNGTEISGLSINTQGTAAAGLMAIGAVRCLWRDLNIKCGTYGIYLYDNCFESVARDISLTVSDVASSNQAQWAFGTCVQAGIQVLENITASGGWHNFLLASGSGSLTGCTGIPQTNGRSGFTLIDQSALGGYFFSSSQTDIESPLASFVSTIELINTYQSTWNNCAITNGSSTQILVTLSGNPAAYVGTHTFNGCAFGPGTATSIVGIGAAASGGKVYLINPQKAGSAVTNFGVGVTGTLI